MKCLFGKFPLAHLLEIAQRRTNSADVHFSTLRATMATLKKDLRSSIWSSQELCGVANPSKLSSTKELAKAVSLGSHICRIYKAPKLHQIFGPSGNSPQQHLNNGGITAQVCICLTTMAVTLEKLRVLPRIKVQAEAHRTPKLGWSNTLTLQHILSIEHKHLTHFKNRNNFFRCAQIFARVVFVAFTLPS